MDNRKIRQLKHGTTVHGTELLGSPARERTTTAYYVPGSGVGQAMQAAPALYGDHARIGVVGLGAGTLACYAKPGQTWRFYEIDPAVVRIARDTGQFHFLSDCLPGAKIEIGDARLNLAVEPTASLDLLTLDAFSSDAVPMHLMTREAFSTYGRVLAPHGVLMVHISNKFLDLEPVVSAAAKAGGWHSAKLALLPRRRDRAAARGVLLGGAVARSGGAGGAEGAGRGLEAASRYPGFTPWSDDYSTILPLVKAFH